MAGDNVVWKSELIANEREARRYYQERLGKLHRLLCYGKEVSVFFDPAATHLYTEEIRGVVPASAIVVRRRLRPGHFDERLFCLDRARLMDRVIPAITLFSVSIPGTGATNAANRLLHGPRMPDGRYMRVVLGPSDDPKMFYCLSAYPISHTVWATAYTSKRAKFPP